MNGGLIGVGFLSLIVGVIFLYLGFGGKVTGDTPFGRYSGPVGAVLALLGIVLMGLGAII
jgi:hypothetical protein